MANNSITVGAITITVNSETTVVLTLELALAILAAIAPEVGLPLWLITLLPILRADIPVAQALLVALVAWFETQKAIGVSHPTAMLTLKNWLTESCQQTQNDNPSFPWT